ncbi:12873_t:CDS:2, partial [Entrophospora sp. SA101]
TASENHKSTLSITDSLDSGEEDLTKSLLAPKTPNIISKRRGSVVSINSPTSTTFSIKTKTAATKIAAKPTEIAIIDNSDKDDPAEDVFHDDLIFNNQFHASKSRNLNHSRSLSQPIRALSTLKSSKSMKINNNDNYLISPTINYDTHSTYKMRTKLTSQKLSNFFGTKPPIDICVKEIEKEGLKAILNSKIPLCYFLYSLLEEYSSENLFFFLEVEHYESRVFDNSTQQLVIAQQIFDTYLTRKSQFEVNVDDKVRKSIIATIKSERDLHYCFRDAKHAVFALLECSFSRFIRSCLTDVMKKEIGQHTAHYSREAYETAVSWLFKYLEKLGPIKVNDYINHHQNNFINNNNHHHNVSSANHLLQKFLKSINNNINNNDSDPNNSGDIGNTDFNHLTNLSKFQPLPSPNSSVSKKRNEMIKNMTLEFITNLLEIDIKDLDMIDNSISSDSTVSSTNSNEEFKSLNQMSNYEGWDIDNNDGNNSGGDSSNPSGKKRELKYRKSVKDLKNPFKKTQRSKK